MDCIGAVDLALSVDQDLLKVPPHFFGEQAVGGILLQVLPKGRGVVSPTLNINLCGT